MNKKIFFMMLLGSLLFAPCLAEITSKEPSKQSHPDTEKKSTENKNSRTKKTEEKMWFRYKDEPLVDIINELAGKKNINIVLPAGKEAIVNKLTFQYPQKITITDAWRRILSILKICGYTIVNENNFYVVTGSDPTRFKDANRQIYPLYSHVKAEDLPDGDEKIRYIHYFTNLQVGAGGSSGGGITTLIQAMLSNDAAIVTDPSSNGLVITDYARNIGSTLHVINELDSHGFTDAIEFIQLKYTSAQTVAQLFQQLINSNQPQQGQQYGAQTSPSVDTSQSQYFAQSTRIVAESRTNSLILMGKKEALRQAKNFIEKNIDIPLGTGESILHIYDLQYLKATDFQPILQSIVSSSNNSGQQGSYGTQSSGSVQNTNGEQYFQGVIIAAEQTGAGAQPNTSNANNSSWGAPGSGNIAAPAQIPQTSNRLVIAARRQDWIRIKKLIEELDKPQLQVAIEALIVDLTLTEDKALGTQMRNKEGLNLKNANYQTSNIGSVVLDGGSTTQNANALMSNLLQLQSNSTTLASSAVAGSLILSFKDKATNGMWLVTELLSNFQDVKILSQPFIVAMNNQNSSFFQSDSRLLAGDVTSSLGGTVQNQVRNDATLGISVLPLISNSGKINLGVDIKVQEYSSATETSQRQLQTNANINDGEVLVLGGLIKTQIVDTITGTPGLKDIPLLGWLFKEKTKTTSKQHLLIFLCPRIIRTETNKFFDPYTTNKINIMTKNLIESENFDKIKDPITHWFFGSPDTTIATKRINDFKNRSMYPSDQDYTTDRKRAGTKIITINHTKKVDDHTIIKTTNYTPPPALKTTEKIRTEKAIESSIKTEQPAKKTYVAQSNTQEEEPKTPLSEEAELKKLFASLDAPKA